MHSISRVTLTVNTILETQNHLWVKASKCINKNKWRLNYSDTSTQAGTTKVEITPSFRIHDQSKLPSSSPKIKQRYQLNLVKNLLSHVLFEKGELTNKLINKYYALHAPTHNTRYNWNMHQENKFLIRVSWYLWLIFIDDGVLISVSCVCNITLSNKTSKSNFLKNSNLWN